MRILIINYFYPPVVNAHAYRWEQIARYWVKQGFQVDVVTGRLRGISDRTVDAGVNVTRVGWIKTSINPSPRESVTSQSFAKYRDALVNAFRPLYRSLYWPDALWHWIPSVMVEIFRRRSTKYDLVISYYPCIGSHLAALTLKKWAEYPKPTWIADYGDPFAISETMPPNNFALYGYLNLLLERHLAQSADSFAFTNESTAAAYKDIVCQPEKLQIIPHLVDIKKFYFDMGKKYSAKDQPVNRIINILYIGGFHRGIREPNILFDLVRRLNVNTPHQFLLNIYGPENGFNLSPSNCPQIKYMGPVERQKAIELMRGADILINVNNKNCVMVPSKIVEYISTGRPLIDLGGGHAPHIAVQRYVESGYAISIEAQSITDENIRLVEAFALSYAGTVAPVDIINKVLIDYTLEVISEKYGSISLGGAV